MVVDILRRLNIFGRHQGVDAWTGVPPGGGVGIDAEPVFDFNDVLGRLQLALSEIDALKQQIVGEIQDLYSRMLSAARRNDRDSLEFYAAEIVIKKRILTAVLAYSKMLRMAIARIQDARNLEQVARVMMGIEYAMRGLDEYLSAVSPEIAAKLSGIISVTEKTVAETGLMARNLPLPASPAQLDPDVEKEIAKVMAEVSREVDELVPTRGIEEVVAATGRAATGVQAKKEAGTQAPGRISEEELDKRLLDYIKSKGGRLRLSEAARELGVTPEDVRASLRRLQEKGLIRVRRRQAQGQ